MLYLSRLLPEQKAGVVDTDDDIEDIISEEELYHIVVDLGLEIAGVDDTGEYAPYQDVRYCSVRQTKLKAMTGVDIRTFKDEITYIETGVKDATIRLSDYCKTLSTSFAWSLGSGTLTMILDDKVKVTGRTLPCGFDGFCWDIREVADKDVVANVYSELVGDAIEDMHAWGNFVIDRPERMDMWRLVTMMTTAEPDSFDVVEEFLLGKNIELLSCFVIEQFTPMFKRFGVESIELSRPFASQNAIKMVKSRLPSDWSVREKCLDYKVACERAIEIRDLWVLVDEVDYVTPRRVFNCCKFLSVTDDVKELCLAYYNRLCEIVIEFCEGFGIDC